MTTMYNFKSYLITQNASKMYLESTLHTQHQMTDNNKEHNFKNDSVNEEHDLKNDSDVKEHHSEQNSKNNDPDLENDADDKQHHLADVPDDKEREFENDLELIVQKNKKGSKPILDLIQLFEKYDGNYRWKIMAQICSYSILFKDSANLIVGVEQFLMLIHDRAIGNSDIVKVRYNRIKFKFIITLCKNLLFYL